MLLTSEKVTLPVGDEPVTITKHGDVPIARNGKHTISTLVETGAASTFPFPTPTTDSGELSGRVNRKVTSRAKGTSNLLGGKAYIRETANNVFKYREALPGVSSF